MTDPATRAQHEAAHPLQSTWLSANAGSGKTRVLTDRVARLLLEEVQPQHILCLTYTKAAASEMQNRLFKRLGAWAMLDDPALCSALRDLGFDRVASDDDLRRARTLFARAIEAPGGLKIQTIHSFCASVLRRFPLEARVSPNFTEIEDRAADLLRADILDQMADGLDRDAFMDLARQYTADDILKLTRTIIDEGATFRDLKLDEALALFGQPAGLRREKLVDQVFAPGDWDLLQELVSVLATQRVSDQQVADVLREIVALDAKAVSIAEAAFLTKQGTRKKRFPTQGTQTAAAHLIPKLDALIDRVEAAREARLALDAAEATVRLHAFATRFATRYAETKLRRGWLDFDDLIEKARGLLSNSRVAEWVLYRLDGGIDHILVDEAQDTSPAQWDVIRHLAQEFSTGEGARSGVTRTIFVVGDKKQSIYSFQGADPGEFDRMQAEFGSKLAESSQTLHDRILAYSFRSSPAILRLVDRVFEEEEAAGFVPDGAHIAFHGDMPGRVDLWPIVPKPEEQAKEKWFDPVDRRSPRHQHRVLAEQIAQQIEYMLDEDNSVTLPDADGPRRVEAKDILILVQRRSGIFPELIRACKKAKLPIAGADRLKVGGELAVRDLGALLSFLATPEDSLSLATVLRSPLFSWSEQDLFTLAHYRTEEHLWQALRKLGDEFPETVSVLQDMRSQVDFLRPYDLIERMLTRHDGRRRLLARLGPEAEDGIDALLSQALAYERGSVPSLTGFLMWMEMDDLEIKRQIDSASNQIRIMTVHGAKGLEAPVVILPECGKRDMRVNVDILRIDDVPVWRMPSNTQPARMKSCIAAVKEAAEAEALRLLYVALTRAEKWLIIGATGDVDEKNPTWHSRVEQAMKDQGAGVLETPVGPGLRLEYGAWPRLAVAKGQDTVAKRDPLPEHFQKRIVSPTATKAGVSPSDLGGAKALPGEGLEEETAKAYGTLVHSLLEQLTSVPSADRAERANIIATGSTLPDALLTEATGEAIRILDTPGLSHLFEPSTLAEVPFTARLGRHDLHGIIDRLIIQNDQVTIIDFKTNRVVPTTAHKCPDGILRQMGAYVHAMEQVFPQHRISSAILWTRTGHLMLLPHDIVTSVLHASPYLDAAGTRS